MAGASSRARATRLWVAALLVPVLAALALLAPPTRAARVSDVSNTKHNLSVSGPGTVKAVSETQICVFCHTPHGANTSVPTPLWNRQLSGESYSMYTSSSMDADDIAANPGGSSKLCLSCHDGTLAIGNVGVLSGQVSASIEMTGTAPGGTMPPGQGAQTGFTRNLGVDLSNDHPISFTYDGSLALADGELRDPTLSPHIGVRRPGFRPVVPLDGGKVECVSCHDPHIRDSDITRNIKFLRLNRFQIGPPGAGAFSEASDIVCLACHDKAGLAWSGSAHADPTVADEVYKSTPGGPTDLREFPPNIRVWEAACLNCHDTHTVPGARRLAREGTDALGVPKVGGRTAIEETCYQCHTTGAESVLTTVTQVPNIKSDFLLPRRMPITSQDQPAGQEIHDIGTGQPGDEGIQRGRDFLEDETLLGKGNLANRHTECTDCHNPHRVMRNRSFNGTGTTEAGTHTHDLAAGEAHTNIASGVLRGTWGVEPLYGSASFHALPSNYFIKRGDGGTGASVAVTSPWVTREYQICLKCHSDYGYDDTNVYPFGTRPQLGNSGGGTPPGTNGLTQFTNQAKELQAPIAHRGEVSTADSGAAATYGVNNHRSWHPVIDQTGRSATERRMSATTALFLAPWNGVAIGTQTMYCSDCHGSNTAVGTVVPPGGENGSPWGPHGSTNNFILKGPWDQNTGTTPDGICFRCHNHTNYATEQNEGNRQGFESGFSGTKDTNLHAFHAKRVGRNLQCTWCHVAVPHGWKNKALLVNLNDVGPEAGLAAGTEVPIGSDAQTYTREPYYLNAKLKVITFARSGAWEPEACGSASVNPDQGREWMKQVCANPP